MSMHLSNGYYGIVDMVNYHKVVGWACHIDSDQTLEIGLFVDGVLVSTVRTQFFREGVQKLGLSKSGIAGFEFNLKTLGIKLNNLSHELRVKIVNLGTQDLELVGSPSTVSNSILASSLLNDWKPSKNSCLLVGLSKTGTSIAAYRIASGLKTQLVNFEPGGNSSLSDIHLHLNLVERANDRPMVTKCILNPQHVHYISEISLLYDKVVFIVRDPRDRIISNFLYHWFRDHNPDREQALRVIEKLKLKEENSGLINFCDLLIERSNVDQFMEGQVNEYNILKKAIDSVEKSLTIKYEDFLDYNISELVDYLEIDDSKSVQGEVDEKYSRVYRSASYGNWKKWFTSVDVREFYVYLDPILQAFGYASEWNLEEGDIDSSLGSDYVSKLFFGEKTA